VGLYLIARRTTAGGNWLLAMTIGLAVLDFTVLVAKCMPPLPTIPMATTRGKR
jgi:hypothetical protein